MPRRAKLTRTKTGLAPAGGGWFVVNAARAQWFRNERFGMACVFEGARRFTQLGINIRVLDPGQANCLYHSETSQEGFLVLSGSCRLLIEEQEIRLRAWDFVHCPPGTKHVFLGAGRKPCVILMVGARRPGEKISYPVSRLAQRHGAGAMKRTSSPRVAYADSPRWLPARGNLDKVCPGK